MVAVLDFTTILGAFSGIGSGCGYLVEESLLLSRSTQPTDYRRKSRCVSPAFSVASGSILC